MVDESISASGVFASAFFVSALSGLVALLRSGEKLTGPSVASATLNSGLLGLGISLIWFLKFRENSYFLIGICVMAGLGGMSTVDLALSIFRKLVGTVFPEKKEKETETQPHV